MGGKKLVFSVITGNNDKLIFTNDWFLFKFKTLCMAM